MLSFKKTSLTMPACGEAFVEGHPCHLPIKHNKIELNAADLARRLNTTPENLIIRARGSAEICIVLTTFTKIPCAGILDPQKILTGTVLDVATYMKLILKDASHTGTSSPMYRYAPHMIRLAVADERENIFKYSFSRGECTGNFRRNFSKWLLLRLPKKPKQDALVNLEKESLKMNLACQASSHVQSGRASNAKSVLSRVRMDFRRYGKSFSGPAYIDQDKHEFITEFLQHDSVVNTLFSAARKSGMSNSFTYKAAFALLERFEELLRRMGTEVSEVDKLFTYRLLLIRQAKLAKSINIPARKITGAVLLNDALHDLPKDPRFLSFSDSLGIFRHAVIHNPTDPVGFLDNVVESQQTLASKDEFRSLQSVPSVIRYALVYYPKDPEGFLRKSLKVFDEICKDPAFSEFAGLPSIMRSIVIKHSKNPKGFLKKVVKQISQISQEPEFEIFAEHEWLIRGVVVDYADDPRKFLRRIKQQSDEILAEEEFAACQKAPLSIYRAILFCPNDPRKELRRRITRR